MIKEEPKDIDYNGKGAYIFTVFRDERLWILSDPDISKFVSDTSFWSFVWRIIQNKLNWHPEPQIFMWKLKKVLTYIVKK